MFTQKDKQGGGPLIDIGVHILDLTLWLMGYPGTRLNDRADLCQIR